MTVMIRIDRNPLDPQSPVFVGSGETIAEALEDLLADEERYSEVTGDNRLNPDLKPRIEESIRRLTEK